MEVIDLRYTRRLQRLILLQIPPHREARFGLVQGVEVNTGRAASNQFLTQMSNNFHQIW